VSRVKQETDQKRPHVLKKAAGLFFLGSFKADFYRVFSLLAAFQAPTHLISTSSIQVFVLGFAG